LALTLAREFTDLLGMGVNLKYVYLARSAADYKMQEKSFSMEGVEPVSVDIPQGEVLYGLGSGWALDLGGIFKVSDLVRAGVMVRNINLGGVKLTGTKYVTDFDSLQTAFEEDPVGFANDIESGQLPIPIKEEEITEPEPYNLPTTLVLGGAFKVPITGLLLAADYRAPLSGGESGSLHVGLEQSILGIIFLRIGGYSVDNGFNYTAGLGGKLGPVLVDAAGVFAESGTTGAFLTLGFKF